MWLTPLTDGNIIKAVMTLAVSPISRCLIPSAINSNIEGYIEGYFEKLFDKQLELKILKWVSINMILATASEAELEKRVVNARLGAYIRI